VLPLIILALVVATAGVLALYFVQQSKAEKLPEVWPLIVKRPLTTPEQVLYFRLVEALPDH
jgi:hypothetical protein